MGTGEFAVPALEAVQAAGHEVSLVVSQPDRRQGRGLTLRPTAVKATALRLGLDVFQPERLRLEAERVISEKARILVVVAYGQILRPDVLECAELGAVNVHASLLPKYRGAAPIQWAIAMGEQETGVTTMQLDAGMDTGPILLQKACPIEPEDTTATLEPKLSRLGATLLVETLEGLERGVIRPRPQEEALATRAPLLNKRDGEVDFSLPAARISDRLRAFSPWPGLHFSHLGRSVRILAAHSVAREGGENDGAVPGTILGIAKEGLDIACVGGSVLRLQRVQQESRGPVSGYEFASAVQLRRGQVMGAPPPGPRPAG